MSECQKVEVNSRDGETYATVEAGIRLGNLYRILWDNGEWSFNGGMCPSVGLGGKVVIILGLISVGGIGYQTRKYGLSADRVVEMSVVLANGTHLPAVNSEKYPDLFWALRGGIIILIKGGQGSFGIVLTYKLKLFKMPLNSMFRLQFEGHDPKVFGMWQDYFLNAEEGLASQFEANNKQFSLKGHYLGTMDDLQMHLKKSGLLDVTGVNVITKSCTGLGSRLFMNQGIICVCKL
jgi:hypothetical protein